MPDNDRFRSGLPGRWLRVQRSIDAGDRPAEVADLVVKAAAEDLRRSGGVSAVAERTEAAESRLGDRRWSDSILDEESVSSRHQLALVAAQRLTQQWALTSPVSALEALADRVVSNLIDDRLDRMVRNLVGTGKLTAGQFADLRDVIQLHPQTTKLREQLIRHPDAVGLQAPRRTVRPLGTDHLLSTDLSDL